MIKVSMTSEVSDSGATVPSDIFLSALQERQRFRQTEVQRRQNAQRDREQNHIKLQKQLH